jgi:DNA-binding response OmpR family regulator
MLGDDLAAEHELTRDDYAAAVLDLGLPQEDGLEVLQSLRTRKITTPVLVLTARDTVPDRIRGLDLEANDYVVKSVDLDELSARLRALVRRAHGQIQGALQCGGVRLTRQHARSAWKAWPWRC